MYADVPPSCAWKPQQRKKSTQQGTVLRQSSTSTAQHSNISTAQQDIAGKAGQATARTRQLRQAQENKDKQKQGKQGKHGKQGKRCGGLFRVVRVGLLGVA